MPWVRLLKRLSVCRSPECQGGKTTSLGLIVYVLLAPCGRHSVTELLSLISVILKEIFLSCGVLGKGFFYSCLYSPMQILCCFASQSGNGILPYLTNLDLYMQMWCLICLSVCLLHQLWMFFIIYCFFRCLLSCRWSHMLATIC